jgi:hypothetical protein
MLAVIFRVKCNVVLHVSLISLVKYLTSNTGVSLGVVSLNAQHRNVICYRIPSDRFCSVQTIIRHSSKVEVA